MDAAPMTTRSMMRPGTLEIRKLYCTYTNGEISFPSWQRDDKWSMEFKKSLIVSILKKRMVPMLYFARLAGAELILDGGHRTRAICEFMDNKFSVSVTDPNGVNTECFYSKSGENTLGDRVKSYFDSYPLPVYRYTDIDEDEAREIFNELQHFRSMTVSECCNAHSSHLIDYMRKLKDVSLVMGHHTKTVYETLEAGSNAFHHPKCHEYILTLLQLFSFFDVVNCLIKCCLNTS